MSHLHYVCALWGYTTTGLVLEDENDPEYERFLAGVNMEIHGHNRTAHPEQVVGGADGLTFSQPCDGVHAN